MSNSEYYKKILNNISLLNFEYEKNINIHKNTNNKSRENLFVGIRRSEELHDYNLKLKLKRINDNFIYEKSQLFPINKSLYKGNYLTIYKKDYVNHGDYLSKYITKKYQDEYSDRLSKPRN